MFTLGGYITVYYELEEVNIVWIEEISARKPVP